MALEKGTEEWMFWGDFFQFCKKYWEPTKECKFWDDFIKDSDCLIEKYNNADYAAAFVLAFADMINKRAKNK